MTRKTSTVYQTCVSDLIEAAKCPFLKSPAAIWRFLSLDIARPKDFGFGLAVNIKSGGAVGGGGGTDLGGPPT